MNSGQTSISLAHTAFTGIQRERKREREREQTKRQVLRRRSKKRNDRIEEDTRTSKIFLHSALDSSLESATESASDLHPPWLRSWIHEKKFWGKISGKRDRWKIENQNSFWNNTYWRLNQQYNWYSFIQWRKQRQCEILEFEVNTWEGNLGENIKKKRSMKNWEPKFFLE